jgi:hypothetical protein
MKKVLPFGLLMFAALLVIGCNKPQVPAGNKRAEASAEGKKYLLAAAPEGAKHVKAARAEAKNDDEVVVEGRIGGDVNPWIDGQAAFNIADPSFKPCNEIEGDDCPTPWDYCCQSDLNSGKALVKIVDGSGNVVRSRAKEFLGLTELDTVIVRGKAVRDENNNLIVLANGVFVKK